MHTLMPSVLVRSPRPDALGIDTQPNPPHRQAGQAGKTATGKGAAIVAANGLRQSIFAKGPLEPGACLSTSGTLKASACQEITSGVIAEGQRVAPATVLRAEMSLEVCAPDLIGL
ncbi:hypothetical protein D9M68_866880 [compost metagenome]